MNARDRWRFRRVTMKEWLRRPRQGIRPRQPLCVVDCDGEARTISAEIAEEGIIIWLEMEEDEEVGLDGSLCQYSTAQYSEGVVVASERPRHIPVPFRIGSRRSTYPQIFLSYRRDDSEAYAGRLHEGLANTFGADAVFMDIFSIRPGEPFPWTIQQAVTHADVIVALIGPKWLTLLDAEGRRRIDNWSDFVRRELVAGLDRKTTIIPVLVAGASPLEATVLPDELRGLEQLQALELTARHWKAGVDELVSYLNDILPRRHSTGP